MLFWSCPEYCSLSSHLSSSAAERSRTVSYHNYLSPSLISTQSVNFAKLVTASSPFHCPPLSAQYTVHLKSSCSLDLNSTFKGTQRSLRIARLDSFCAKSKAIPYPCSVHQQGLVTSSASSLIAHLNKRLYKETHVRAEVSLDLLLLLLVIKT